jgi:hypothetical protein
MNLLKEPCERMFSSFFPGGDRRDLIENWLDRFCPKEGGTHVVDDSRNTLDSMDAWVCDRLYDGFWYPHYLRSRGCPTCGQSKSGGHDQPEFETCIATSWPKTRWKTEAGALNGPADTITDYALKYKMAVGRQGYV